MNLSRIFILVLCLSAGSLFAQNCKKENIIGEWIPVASHAGIHTNVDSMKKVADTSRHSDALWTFYDDGMYTFTGRYNRGEKKTRLCF